MTTFDTDPNTEAAQTVASAWSSSSLGQPDHDAGYGFADDTVAAQTIAEEPAAEDRSPTSKHAIVALALAAGIGAGAAMGLMFVDFTPDGPVVVPGSTSPEHAVVVTEGHRPAPTGPALTTVAPAPANKPADANVPPASTVGGSSEVVDVPAPVPPPAPEKPAAEEPEVPAPEEPQAPAPEEPEIPEPENPDPQPPGPENPWVPDDLDIANDNPVGPDPAPEFEVPIALPVPQPDPKPLPLPDVDVKASP